jgi:hypothetical protein
VALEEQNRPGYLCDYTERPWKVEGWEEYERWWREVKEKVGKQIKF